MIKIYNTLTRQKEEFIPQVEGEVKMYTCGVTVYDDCHIGHARSLYIFDVIRRYLEYRGYKVNFVRNITDIDDKIINRANELNSGWKELVEKYISSYYQDLKSLELNKADIEPKATENITEMITYITKLIEKGFAYVTSTGVYFNVRKFSSYGKLSGQSIEAMREGVRKASDETKNDPLDFALWKTAKPDEPSWDSPWGKGRPGWHIECSVMSRKYLKCDTLDIHAGGRDLVFPHHENETAQSEALTGKSFAKYWIHHGLLTINEQKMSKSLGNFITIKDVVKKCHPDILKLIYLQAHYSSSMDFSWEKITEAKKAYEHIVIIMSKLSSVSDSQNISHLKDTEELSKFKQQFIEYMDDDFNTPRALSIVFDLISSTNKLMDHADSGTKQKLIFAFKILKEMLMIFGITLSARDISDNIAEIEIEKLIKNRLEAKAKKDYKKADQIRKELENNGVILEDTKDGKTSWRRKI